MQRCYAILILLTMLTLAVEVHAARVSKVSGKSVLIEMEDLEMQEGEKYYVVIDGKKKGVVQINKVSKGRARGKVTNGRAEVDATVIPTGKSSKTAAFEQAGDEDAGS